VCTTELARILLLGDEFKKRGVKMIALSCDSVDDHKYWSKVCFRLSLTELSGLHHTVYTVMVVMTHM